MAKQLLIATSNQGKVKEFDELYAQANLNVELVSLKTLNNYQDPVEDANSFVGNALIKAYAAAKASGMAAMADDSGLCVQSLEDKPGIYSARFAAMHNFTQDNLDKDKLNYSCLLEQMQGHSNRKAYFYCCLVLVRFPDDPTPIIAVGKTYGHILEQAQGTNGHGYDPIFFSDELQMSFGLASSEQKNSVSHRAKAFTKLVEQIKEDTQLMEQMLIEQMTIN